MRDVGGAISGVNGMNVISSMGTKSFQSQLES
jgi:hypothetical protein